MITVVGNVKGGVGKTTIAVNLAIGLALRGQDVLLIDGDEQGTAAAFSETRAEKRPQAKSYTSIRLQGAAIRTQVRLQLAKRYDHIVIDVGGRDSGSLRAALLVCDLLVIPTQPRSFDLWGVDDTFALVREAREVRDDLRAMVLLNLADPAGSRNQESLDGLASYGALEVFPHPIVRRTAFPAATDEGLSILEYTDHNNRAGCLKAREDFARFLDAVYGASGSTGSTGSINPERVSA